MLNVSNKTFMPTAMNDYKERFTYNPDGGIITLQRNGAGNTVIDNANWSYYANTHRLEQIADPAGRTGFDAGNQSANNYAYNEIGEMTSDAERGLTNDWTVYGKLKTQTINGTTITYTYDATGNRISKQLSNGYKEFYVRDASGNVMSIYRSDVNTAIAQTEVHLYGSSRIGMTTTHTVPDENIKLLNGFIDGTKRTFTRGEKTFELGDHRSNNLVTISDRRQQISSDNNTVESYVANIITAQDYSSFGSILQGRKFGIAQRYTYNAKQLDSETGWQDYGMRNYLVDVPVFGSVDALAAQYPWYTPYQFAGNKPIIAVDLDGLEERVVINYYSRNKELERTSVITLTNKESKQLVDMQMRAVMKNGQLGSLEAQGKKVLVRHVFSDDEKMFASEQRDVLTQNESYVLNNGQKLNTGNGSPFQVEITEGGSMLSQKDDYELSQFNLEEKTVSFYDHKIIKPNETYTFKPFDVSADKVEVLSSGKEQVEKFAMSLKNSGIKEVTIQPTVTSTTTDNIQRNGKTTRETVTANYNLLGKIMEKISGIKVTVLPTKKGDEGGNLQIQTK